MPTSNIVPIRHHPDFKGKTKQKVLLRNNVTGEERFIDSDSEWDDVHEFLWTEGNFGCDCNRALFFARAGGEEDPLGPICGTAACRVPYAVRPDGTRLPIDDDPESITCG